MQHLIRLTLLVIIAAAMPAAAFDHRHPPDETVPGGTGIRPGEVISHDMRVRLGLPVRVPLGPELREQIERARRDKRHHHPGIHGGLRETTTVVHQIQPIVVVTPPAADTAAAPTPAPEREWVPPVTETVTRPGYWDYGIQRTWMGDHWRYEQDRTEKNWVPPQQVEVTVQEGYWRTVE